MFRKMRRDKQELNKQEVQEILQNAKTAILALLGDNGYPYAVPVNFVFYQNKIYLHSAKQGHKIDAIKNHSKISLCVISQDEVIAKKLTTAYKSVIIFGKAKILQDENEIFNAAQILGLKYNKDKEFVQASIKQSLPRFCCIEIIVEHASGKQGKELLKS